MVSLSPRARALLWDLRRPTQLERLAEVGQQADITVTVSDHGDVDAVLVSHDLVFGPATFFSGDLLHGSLGASEVERPLFFLQTPRPVTRGEEITIRVDVLASGLGVKIL